MPDRSRRGGGRPDELGAHMSIAGGLSLALERGHALGCGAVQIFLKSHRRWAATPLGADQVRAFAEARRRTGIRTVFAHASYLINLAAPGDAQRAQAVDALSDELERAEALGLSCVVVHPGSHRGAGREQGLGRIVAALDAVTARAAGFRVKVALENTAGGGDALGRSFAELATLIARVARPEKLGVCIDTCHLFAAGYDIRTAAGWQAAVDECAQTIGWSRVLAFHLNDAAADLGSGLDRHAAIGGGQVGLVPFRLLLATPSLARIPKVLETPKDPEPVADRRNLALLRRLRRASRCPAHGRPRGGGTPRAPTARDGARQRGSAGRGQR